MKTSARNELVGAERSGQKLLTFLRHTFAGQIPDSALMRLIRTGQVRVDGHRAGPYLKLLAENIVRLPPVHLDSLKYPNILSKKECELNDPEEVIILAEKNDTLAVLKPAGLPVHPGSKHTDSLTSRVKDKYPTAKFTPVPAHRLDKFTSGILLFGLTFNALRGLQDFFLTGMAEKYYLAWVWGEIKNKPECPILLEDHLIKAISGSKEKIIKHSKGKMARTFIWPLYELANKTLVLARPLTGRTHQIRVQLAEFGHPLIGDGKYGGGKGTFFLHASHLNIPGMSVTSYPDWSGEYSIPNKIIDELSSRLPPNANLDPEGMIIANPEN